MPIEPVKIPQNVYVEDRIVGPITLRQLIILLATGAFSYGIWTTAKSQLGASSVPLTIVCWIPFLIGIIFAFVRIQGISLMRFILLMAEKMDKPAVRLWSPRRGITINFQYFSGVEEKKKKTVTQPHREKLEELSAMLDQGPVVTAKNGTQNETAAISAEEPAIPRPVDQSRIRAEASDDGFPFDDIKTAHTPGAAERPPQNSRVTMRDILPPSGAHT
ncbi:MAG: PrgI family protein [Candidatus Peribacteraceae bacterium]|nr:PrgI family protein [Candidatus Peribacteraceae bacterium]MDD5742590.1 PrgI family protein [Candidatus Peribacteraceae bacterium]